MSDTAVGSVVEAEQAARLRLAVTRLHRALRQQVVAGLTPAQIATLATVERLGSPTLGELASAERVQPPSMTRMVGALEAADMVERTLDVEDRRVARVATTANGRRTLQKIRSLRTALLVKRMRRLSAGERERLADALPVLERLVDEP